MTMKITFILKDLSEEFFTGFGDIVGFAALSNDVKFSKLLKMSAQSGISVKAKIGAGAFRDRVELNQLMRKPCTYIFKLEPRKGYQLATFEIAA
jgi:hypothetical protein